MNKEKLFELIENPLLIAKSDVNDLKELVDDYPFFHAAHLLLLKGLHAENSLKFDQQLQQSAIHIPDRKKLYQVLFFADQLFEKKLETGEEIKAEDNLQEVTSSEKKAKVSDEPMELLDFDYEEEHLTKQQKQQPKQKDLLEYEYSSDVSNTYLPGDYFASYQLDDESQIDEDAINSFYTFEEWLKMMREKKASKQIAKNESKPPKKENEQFELIDNFIKEKPKIVPKKDVKKASNVKVEESLEEKTDFITETLASIYTRQGHYAKAILAYQKLSLKYPEKNSYFADQIKKLEKLIKEQ